MNEHHYAVIIGINRYPGISDLQFARGDAEVFYEWLKDPDLGGVPEDNIALITVEDAAVPPGTAPENAIPVRKQVIDALSKFRKRVATHIEDTPEDWRNTRLYVFGSGHGIAPEPQEAAILMADAEPMEFGKNFPYGKFITYFQKAQFFKELVFFADCCRERVTTAPLLGPPWNEINNNNGRISTVRGLATYFGELAFEEDDDDTPPDELRGYFTKALLEGLNGEAVDEKTNEITSISLANYVTERVQKLTGHRPHPQKPFFVTEPQTDAVVFRRNVLTVAEHNVTIHFPTGFTGSVILRGSDIEPMAHDAATGDLVVPLASGFYRVVPEVGDNPFTNGGFFEVIGDTKHVEL